MLCHFGPTQTLIGRGNMCNCDSHNNQDLGKAFVQPIKSILISRIGSITSVSHKKKACIVHVFPFHLHSHFTVNNFVSRRLNAVQSHGGHI